MTTDVKTVEPEMRLVDLEAFFADEGVSGAPVVSGDRLIGVVSRSDVVRLLAEESQHVRAAYSFYYYLSPWDGKAGLPELVSRESSTTLGARLETLKVRDAMTSHILSIAPDASVEDTCQEMAAHGVHRLLVIEGGMLRGLVSSIDIVRAVGERRLSR
jgi:CBS domain-containing protein